MADGAAHTGPRAGRLNAEALAQNFTDLHPRLTDHEALVASDRCYFCYDAPCVTACPTEIDIPLFIRQISTGTPDAAARTILSQNILGGMCARVCPTETLCEEACVRETAEGAPVLIGRLQRYATDVLMASGQHPFTRAAATGKTVAVVGAGPSGLACAHRLAMLGHEVTIFESRAKGGGLNEFGIAAYKSVDGFAQAELAWLLGIGGITIQYDAALGTGVTLEALQAGHDAVFLGMGLAGVNALGISGDDLANADDAVAFIAGLRQSGDFTDIAVGDKVVVIGGGMTAIDAAVQSKLLGASEVTMVYRRDKASMGASEYEQDLATSSGVHIVYSAQPVAVLGEGSVSAVRFEHTATSDGKLTGTGEQFEIAADHVLRAIGQSLQGAPGALKLDGRKIAVDAAGRTSAAGIWAGGDCASGGDDLTVTAVAEGRDAAMDIHASLGA